MAEDMEVFDRLLRGASPSPPERERPDVADLVHHHEGVARRPGEDLVEVALPVRDRGVQGDFPSTVTRQAQWGLLPTSIPSTGPVRDGVSMMASS